MGMIEIDGVEIPEEIVKKVKAEGYSDGHKNAQKDFKKKLAEFIPESAREEIGDEFFKRKTSEIFGDISGMIKKEIEALKTEKSTNDAGDKDKLLEIEKRYSKELEDLKKALTEKDQSHKRGLVFEKLKAAAAAKNLKEKYLDDFEYFLKKYIDPELDGDKLIFRNKADESLIMAGDKPAGMLDAVEFIRSKEPELFEEPKAGMGSRPGGKATDGDFKRDGVSSAKLMEDGDISSWAKVT